MSRFRVLFIFVSTLHLPHKWHTNTLPLYLINYTCYDFVIFQTFILWLFTQALNVWCLSQDNVQEGEKKLRRKDDRCSGQVAHALMRLRTGSVNVPRNELSTYATSGRLMLIFLSHVTKILLLATYSAFIAYISKPTTF